MGDLVEVFGALRAGDEIVARATEDLSDGTRVVAKNHLAFNLSINSASRGAAENDRNREV
jgi:hypothetical protein